MKRSEPRIFHYTIAELYNLIQQDQLIKPATEPAPEIRGKSLYGEPAGPGLNTAHTPG
jgi:hypothetical protein